MITSVTRKEYCIWDIVIKVPKEEAQLSNHDNIFYESESSKGLNGIRIHEVVSRMLMDILFNV